MSQTTPSDKTELKTESFFKELDKLFSNCRSLTIEERKSIDEFFWSQFGEPSKPSETPMSKEDPTLQQKFDGSFPYCDHCKSYHHVDYHKYYPIPSPNPLPSSHTDKCRDVDFELWWNNYPASDCWNQESIDLAYTYAKAAWQASRKECEEELQNLRGDLIQRNMQIDALRGDVAFHQAERVKASNKRQIAVDISVEHIQENAQLKEENKKWRIHYQDEAKRRCKLQEHIASLQSVVEAKDEALKAAEKVVCLVKDRDNLFYAGDGNPLPPHLAKTCFNPYSLSLHDAEIRRAVAACAAIHIDQSGGKKEEEEV